MSGLTATSFQTKSDVAYTNLQKLIATRQWVPGQRMTVRKIATDLGMSETPVREALKRMEAEGYVVSVSHVGYRVAKLSQKELEELFAVRAALESLALQLAFPGIDSHLIAKLRQLLEQMDTHFTRHKLQLWRKANREFHDTLYGCCGNDTLIALIRQMRERSNYARGFFSFTAEREITTREEHSALVTSLEKRNTSEAVKILKRHLANSLDVILASQLMRS